MDIGAYMNIEDLDSVAEANDIHIPRLRGYRLMKNETKLDRDEALSNNITGQVYSDLVHSVPPFSISSYCYRYGGGSRRLEKKYLIKTGDFRYILRWENVHGKNAKYAIKKAKRAVYKNIDTFNKYVGRDDVLYIHARIGGDNWLYYGGKELESQPWFLEKVDDFYDSTYCDIYAKIKPI